MAAFHLLMKRIVFRGALMEVLPKRFGKYGLTVHPEKTKIVDFNRPDDKNGNKPDSFNFLGFCHYWAKSRKGKWVIKRKTEKGRFSRVLHKMAQWCKENRHLPLKEQQTILNAKLKGHYAYYGITCNNRRLRQFFLEVNRLWHKWLNRRSNKYDLSWKRFDSICERLPLALPKIVHSVYSG